VAGAQQKDPRVNPPLAPIESSSKPVAESPALPAPPPAQVQPDNAPLSGARDLSLGWFGSGRSFLLPSLSFSQGFNSYLDASGSTHYTYQATVYGSLALRKTTRNRQVGMAYSTGGSFYRGAGFSSPVHTLSFFQQSQWRRWTLAVADSLSFLPESGFGYGGYGGFGGLPQTTGVTTGSAGFANSNPANLNPAFLPNQSILTQPAKRIANSTMGQIQYSLSARTSITASGSYGLLHVLKSGYVDSSSGTFQSGITHDLTSRDSIAVTYRFGLTRFGDVNRGINNHTAGFSYGRRITGRLALQVFAGPNYATFVNPVTGSGDRLSWSFGSSLGYATDKTDLNFGYHRFLTGGSGVLLGAETDNLGVSYGRQLTRMWGLGLSASYAHNSSLRALTGSNVRETFDSWHAGLSLGRPLGRQASISFSYGVAGQSGTNCSSTVVVGCTSRAIRHFFNIGFNFHSLFRPIEL
jgi:hypothetical protein